MAKMFYEKDCDLGKLDGKKSPSSATALRVMLTPST